MGLMLGRKYVWCLHIVVIFMGFGILDLKKGFNKPFKNIPPVSEDLLRIAWKCMKIALII